MKIHDRRPTKPPGVITNLNPRIPGSWSPDDSVSGPAATAGQTGQFPQQPATRPVPPCEHPPRHRGVRTQSQDTSRSCRACSLSDEIDPRRSGQPARCPSISSPPHPSDKYIMPPAVHFGRTSCGTPQSFLSSWTSNSRRSH